MAGYNLGLYGNPSEGDTRYEGYIDKEKKELFWKEPMSNMLYSSEGGKPRGYIGKDGEFHFHIPDFGPMETRDEAGEITSQRGYLEGSLEDIYRKSPEVAPISNIHLTSKEGQDYFGFGFPKDKVSIEDMLINSMKE
tara:strand:- start:81 stop:491 length:411 start_codon:yes stop_codon:yes gene_type:complete